MESKIGRKFHQHKYSVWVFGMILEMKNDKLQENFVRKTNMRTTDLVANFGISHWDLLYIMLLIQTLASKSTCSGKKLHFHLKEQS